MGSHGPYSLQPLEFYSNYFTILPGVSPFRLLSWKLHECAVYFLFQIINKAAMKAGTWLSSSGFPLGVSPSWFSAEAECEPTQIDSYHTEARSLWKQRVSNPFMQFQKVMHIHSIRPGLSHIYLSMVYLLKVLLNLPLFLINPETIKQAKK